jgi:hypothetical protein
MQVCIPPVAIATIQVGVAIAVVVVIVTRVVEIVAKVII